MAQVLARELNVGVQWGEIVQSNRVGHTRAPSFNRLVTPPTFEGDVVGNAAYVIVDDHVGLGGTLANLKGYVESHGATVIAMTTLTETRGARQIAPTGNPECAKGATWRPTPNLLAGTVRPRAGVSYGTRVRGPWS